MRDDSGCEMKGGVTDSVPVNEVQVCHWVERGDVQLLSTSSV